MGARLDDGGGAQPAGEQVATPGRHDPIARRTLSQWRDLLHIRAVIGRALTGSQGRVVELESGAGDTAKDRLLQLALYVTNEIVANIPSATLRHSWYRRVLGVDMAEGAKVFMHVTMSVRGRPRPGRGGISVGRNSLINQHCWIDGRGGLRIGANVNVSRGVWFLGGDHNIDDPAFTTRFAPTEVGDRAFLGCRAQILAGVKIGEGAVVAAGALVTKDVPAYAVVAGVPARIVRTRRRDLHYELAYSPMFE